MTVFEKQPKMLSIKDKEKNPPLSSLSSIFDNKAAHRFKPRSTEEACLRLINYILLANLFVRICPLYAPKLKFQESLNGLFKVHSVSGIIFFTWSSESDV